MIVHICYNVFCFLTFYYNPTLQKAVSIPFIVLVCVHAVLGMLTLLLSSDGTRLDGYPKQNLRVILKRVSAALIFPLLIVHDLVVDRTPIHETLRRSNVFIESFDPGNVGKREKTASDHWHEYEIEKCLKCGLCLEVCPNYTSGANFFGALFANDCYLVAARNKAKAGEIKALYDEHCGRDCSKALSCMDVCPAGISTIALMARLNR